MQLYSWPVEWLVILPLLLSLGQYLQNLVLQKLNPLLLVGVPLCLSGNPLGDTISTGVVSVEVEAP